MDTIDLLLTRRSVVAKDMGEPGPDDATLDKILGAGIRVPDHGKLGPWRIQVLRKAGQKALGEVLAKIYAAENPGAEERLVEAERQRPQRAPILLAVTARIDPHHPKIPVMEQQLSGGALCQNILVAAHASGFVAQWLTEWPAFHPEVRKALGHAPETEIIGFIYIGTPMTPPNERPRPTLEQVVSEWTEPAA
jgi:nitroreductase